MNPSRRRASLPVVGAFKSGAGWSALPGRVALAALAALSLLAWSAIAAPGHARAANSPRLVFAAPLYPSQTRGVAEGPVGTSVTVKGSGWTPPDSTPNSKPVTVSLADARNDTPGRAGSACQNSAPQITIPFVYSTYLPDSTGSFTANFQWPLEAGTRGHSYWACGKQGDKTSAGVSKFTVLSANPPAVVINITQAAPGSNITVTGHNWLPGGIHVRILIVPCLDCTPPFYSNTQATSQPDGSFGISTQVPSDAPLDTTLYVTAQNIDPNNPSAGNSGTLGAGYTVPIKFTVIAQAAVTATPTAASTPTIIDTAQTGGSDSSSGSSSGNTVLIVLLAALSIVWLVAAVVIALLLFRRPHRQMQEVSGRDGPL